MTTFSELDLIEPLMRALNAENYTKPTPIQEQSIPYLLEGRDLLGVAQTGTGKTAAFVLPMLQRLSAKTEDGRPKSCHPRALILAPTRELAVQIGDSVRSYGQFMHIGSTNIFGGAPIGKQIRALERGVDIVVATPGRLIDLINQRKLFLDQVSIFVLDEADRMLDMGFVKDVKKIASLVNRKRQTLLFSATMPPEVGYLAEGLLSDPIRVEVAAQSTTAERVNQRIMFVEKGNKRDLLSDLMQNDEIVRALVFTRTKHGANKVATHLEHHKVSTGVIHGNKSQTARQNALNNFKKGKHRVLVATDIAARGIDVDGVTHVINFDLPNLPENYVHRIGRTARAGAAGEAISFCDHEERAYLFDIEKATRQKISVDIDHDFHEPSIANAGIKTAKAAKAKMDRENLEKQKARQQQRRKKWTSKSKTGNKNPTSGKPNYSGNRSSEQGKGGIAKTSSGAGKGFRPTKQSNARRNNRSSA